MKNVQLSRRQFAVGFGIALLGAGSPALRACGSQRPLPAPIDATGLETGYARLAADLAACWFTDQGTGLTGGRPGILPTNGSGDPDTGTTRGLNRYSEGAMWQAAQYGRFLRNDWQLRPSGPSARRLRQQWRQLRATYTPAQLGGDGSDGTVNASDDGAWKMQYLQSLHQATGDPAILTAMSGGLAAILNRYRDPSNGGANVIVEGPLAFSRFGILYATPGEDPNGQGRSTTYEAGLMMAALYLYGHSREPAYLDYVRTVYASFRAKLRHPSGIYYQSLQIDPARRHDSTPYLQPIEIYRGLPKQGYTGLTVCGTSAMAVLAARLYRLTRDRTYLEDAVRTVDGMGALQVQNGCILNDRDPWVDGFYFLDVSREVLSLPGVDTRSRVQAAIVATGHRVLGTRAHLEGLPACYSYSAEWSGNTLPTVGGAYVTWQQSAATANAGQGGGGGDPRQIMTDASSGMMVQAALLLVRGSQAGKSGSASAQARAA